MIGAKKPLHPSSLGSRLRNRSISNNKRDPTLEEMLFLNTTVRNDRPRQSNVVVSRRLSGCRDELYRAINFARGPSLAPFIRKRDLQVYILR